MEMKSVVKVIIATALIGIGGVGYLKNREDWGWWLIAALLVCGTV